jgi:hypothetical protein
MVVHQDVIYARQDTFNYKHSSTTARIANLIVVSNVPRKDDDLYFC